MSHPSRRESGRSSLVTLALGALIGAAGLYAYLHGAEVVTAVQAVISPPAATTAPRPVAKPVQAAAPAAPAPAPGQPEPHPANRSTAETASAAAPPRQVAAAAPAPQRAPAAAAPVPAAARPPVAPVVPPAAPPAPGATRSFAMGHPEAENVRDVSKKLTGFRNRPGVQVKRIPEVDGMIHFEVSPTSLRPGDRYTLKTYLVHSGRKPIRIDEMTVSTSVDGSRSASRVSPLAKQVPPGMNILLDQRSGVVKPGTRSWMMEVAVTSNHQDVYRNRVSLK